MPILKPSKPSRQPRSLLSTLFPSPLHPRATPRTAATAVILLFLTVVAWLAVMEPDFDINGEKVETLRGMGWRSWSGEVDLGNVREWHKGETVLGAQAESVGVSDEKDIGVATSKASSAVEDDAKQTNTTAAGPTSSPLSNNVTAASFTAFRAAEIEQLRREGNLSAYVWHQRWEGWAKTKGRLIVVGDIHGRHESYSALLERVSLSPLDVLLHTGDLVSKAPLSDSLASVALMRELEARGVRGNHDQGVIEWRQWMKSYGPLLRTGGGGVSQPTQAQDLTETEDEKAEDLAKLYKEAEAAYGGGKAPWRGVGGEKSPNVGYGSFLPTEAGGNDGEMPPAQGARGEDPSRIASKEVAGQRMRKVKRAFGWSQEIPVITDTDEGLVSSAARGSSLDEDEDGFGKSGLGSSSSSSYSGDKSTSSTPPPLPLSTPSLNMDGALLGEGWEWLTMSQKEVEAELAVVIPKGWEWGGDWFEIARHLPEVDAQYLAELPLTLWLEGLGTYLVHAGMVPWKDVRHFPASFSTSSASTSSLPVLSQSASASSFIPTTPPAFKLTSPALSLLTLPENTLPFTLLNMRGLKKHKHGDWTVSKKKADKPWFELWNERMEECEDAENGCEQVGVVYGHWAGKGLTINTNTIGLDSACAAGKRLSMLVVPSSSYSTTNSLSPLKTASTHNDDPDTPVKSPATSIKVPVDSKLPAHAPSPASVSAPSASPSIPARPTTSKSNGNAGSEANGDEQVKVDEEIVAGSAGSPEDDEDEEEEDEEEDEEEEDEEEEGFEESEQIAQRPQRPSRPPFAPAGSNPNPKHSASSSSSSTQVDAFRSFGSGKNSTTTISTTPKPEYRRPGIRKRGWSRIPPPPPPETAAPARKATDDGVRVDAGAFESLFEEESVTFAGRDSWIVSVACGVGSGKDLSGGDEERP